MKIDKRTETRDGSKRDGYFMHAISWGLLNLQRRMLHYAVQSEIFSP